MEYARFQWIVEKVHVAGFDAGVSRVFFLSYTYII